MFLQICVVRNTQTLLPIKREKQNSTRQPLKVSCWIDSAIFGHEQELSEREIIQFSAQVEAELGLLVSRPA